MAIEQWYPEADIWKNLLSDRTITAFGDAGYPGFDGMFINNISEEIIPDNPACGMERNNIDVFVRYFLV